MLRARLVSHSHFDIDPDLEKIMGYLDLEGFDAAVLASEIREGLAGCMVLEQNNECVGVLTMLLHSDTLEVRTAKTDPKMITENIHEVIEFVEEIARMEGKSRVVVYGRPGWNRLPAMRRAGYRSQWVAVSKRLH